MKGLIHKEITVKKEGQQINTVFRNAALAAGTVATAAALMFSCSKPGVVDVTNQTPVDTSQTNKKINIPPGLDLGAPLDCGASVSNCVRNTAVSLFGNVPIMLDTVRTDSTGKDTAAILDVIGRDSTSYIIYKQPISLAPHGSKMLDIGLDSVLVRLDTIYGPASVNVTVTKVCRKPESCKSMAASIDCGNPTVTDTVRLGQTIYAGQFPMRLDKIIDISLGKKTALAKTASSDHSVQLTLLRNDCSVAATPTINEGKPTTVQVGIYSLVVTAQKVVEIHMQNVIDSSYAVIRVENICPQ